jgi:flavin-dependent dehydrogenase
MSPVVEDADVVIIGAGPSGTVAGAILVNLGYSVSIVERQSFPRFSIGESLLPQCMQFLEEAGLLSAVTAAGFQVKDGAKFECGNRHAVFDFNEKFSSGWGTTFEVQRDRFDKILADEATRLGVHINFGASVTSVDFSDEGVVLHAVNADDQQQIFRGKFLLDASGFGRVLPRLLQLDRPSEFPVRKSVFTHIEDRISSACFDRNKILITIHPDRRDVWYWLIPFSNGRSSLGLVAEADYLDSRGEEGLDLLKQLVSEAPGLRSVLKDAAFDRPAQAISGYAATVETLFGDRFALLGNAAEFLDPVFSSGVTIAMKSASLAAAAIDRQFRGLDVDWTAEFADPLMLGVNTFRTYVQGWYDETFQDIIFHPAPNPRIKGMICSILAGYAWDEKNPYVRDSRRRMSALAIVCNST